MRAGLDHSKSRPAETSRPLRCLSPGAGLRAAVGKTQHTRNLSAHQK